jgi:hypothetical protein
MIRTILGEEYRSFLDTVTLKIYENYIIGKYGPGVDSASNKNEYQEYFLG